jgi:hypothetical protein
MILLKKKKENQVQCRNLHTITPHRPRSSRLEKNLICERHMILNMMLISAGLKVQLAMLATQPMVGSRHKLLLPKQEELWATTA